MSGEHFLIALLLGLIFLLMGVFQKAHSELCALAREALDMTNELLDRDIPKDPTNDPR